MSSVRTEMPILVRAIVSNTLRNACTECTVSLSLYSDSNQNIVRKDLNCILDNEETRPLSRDSSTKDECFVRIVRHLWINNG
jgi:hypothetical protein